MSRGVLTVEGVVRIECLSLEYSEIQLRIAIR